MRFIALIGFVVASAFSGLAQSKAPEPGVYKGSSSISGVTSTSSYPGAGVNESTYGVQSTTTSSVFGDLILNKNGTYKLTTGGEGTWKYNEVTGAVTFTGKLSKSKIKYNYYPEYLNFQVSFPYNGQYIHSSFSKKRAGTYIKPKSPNVLFTGVAVADVNEGTFSIIDVQTGKSVKTCRGYHPSKNANGDIVALSSFNGKSDVYLYDKNGELKSTIGGQKIVSSDIIHSYYSASISEDGKYIALAGSLAGNYISGEPIYAIIDTKGDPVFQIKTGLRNGWTPQWADDNQVIIRGTNKIALVNFISQTAKTLYPNDVDFAALSKSKKKLAFIKDNRVNILNLDSGKIEPFANGKHDEILSKHYVKSLSWLDDDSSLACGAQGNGIVRYKILLLSADGSKAKYLSNDNGEDWTLTSEYFSW